MRTLTVYKITDSSNGMIYIGSTLKPFEVRMKAHVTKGGNTGLCDWFPEIEPKNLSGKVVALIFNPTKEELSKRTLESFVCLHYRNSGYSMYNKRIDAIHHSKETKIRISKACMERTPSKICGQKLKVWGQQHLPGNTLAAHYKVVFEGNTFYGAHQLYKYLCNDTDYDLTESQVRHLVNDRNLSKKVRQKYPNLFSDVSVEKLM